MGVGVAEAERDGLCVEPRRSQATIQAVVLGQGGVEGLQMRDVVGINPVDGAAQFGPFVGRQYLPCFPIGCILPGQGMYLLVDAGTPELLVLQLQFFCFQPVDGLPQVLCLLHLVGLLVGLFLLQAVEGFLVAVYFLLEGVLALFQFLQDAFVDQLLPPFLLLIAHM